MRVPRVQARLEEAQHFVNFAIGSYGWPLYTLMDPLDILTCRICGDCARGGGRASSDECTRAGCHTGPHVMGGTCMNASVEAFLRRTGIPKEDLLLANLDNSIE
jgi:hypothetical protein